MHSTFQRQLDDARKQQTVIVAPDRVLPVLPAQEPVTTSAPVAPETEPMVVQEAVATDPVEPVAYDPADYTVAEVLEYVDTNPNLSDAVLAAEIDGKNRATIVAALSAGI